MRYLESRLCIKHHTRLCQYWLYMVQAAMCWLQPEAAQIDAASKPLVFRHNMMRNEKKSCAISQIELGCCNIPNLHMLMLALAFHNPECFPRQWVWGWGNGEHDKGSLLCYSYYLHTRWENIPCIIICVYIQMTIEYVTCSQLLTDSLSIQGYLQLICLHVYITNCIHTVFWMRIILYVLPYPWPTSTFGYEMP